MSSVQHDELMCAIERAEFEFTRRIVHLFLPDLNCTDQGGAVRFSERVMPDVQQIVVYQDGREDYRYLRVGERWKCRDAVSRYAHAR